MHLRRALALLPFVFAGCVSETTVQQQICADASAPKKAIAACSKLIDSGDVTGRELAVVLYNRATVYSTIESLDKALMDLSAATRLAPEDAQFIGGRGIVYGMKGDVDAAILDFTAAIKAEPSWYYWYLNRGKARSEKNDFAGAIPDFDGELVVAQWSLLVPCGAEPGS